MGYNNEEVLYVTGVDMVEVLNKNKKQNMEGCGMVNVNKGEMVTVEGSKLHKVGTKREFQHMEYIENGIIYAQGEGVLSTVESYLEGYLGYDLTDIENDYEWVEYPRNRSYEVCELGIVRNKDTGRVLHMSLKGKYERGSKDVWRLRVTIPNVGTLRISQVVAETFLEDKECMEGIVVGHKNDVPIDNRVENLEYITSDENKTIDWVLRDVVYRNLTLEYVSAVYKQIEEVLEDKYGKDFEVKYLTDEDEIEVTEYVDIYKRSVGEIYKYVKYGEGILSNLTLIDGKFYI